MDDVASVKSMLRAVLMSCKDGVAAHILQRDYREMTGEPLPFRKLGFNNLDDFIYSIPDVVQIRKNNKGDITYHAKASQQTAHIQNMVSKQKNTKRRRKLTPLTRRPATQSFVPRPLYPRNSRPPSRYNLRSYSSPRPAYKSSPYSPSKQSYSGLQVRLSDTPNQTSKHRSVTFEEIGRKTLSRAMDEANTDRNEDRSSFGSRFDVPPRFRKLQHEETSRPILLKTPAKKAPPHHLEKTEFDTVLDGRKFYEKLAKYARQNFNLTSLAAEFNTLPVKIGGSAGYVSSLTFSGKVYGSEDAFETPEEATYAVARKVCLELDTNTKRDSSPADRRPSSSISESVLKSRVKELLYNKANGMWKKRLLELYKDEFKEDPPDHLFHLIKEWKDVASIQESAVPDNEIITPVPSGTTQEVTKPVTQTPKAAPAPKETPQASTPAPRITYQPPLPPTQPTVTELRQRADNSTNVKDLIIPKGEPLPLEEQVTVYITFFHNCGYFCVQREDCPIEEISTLLTAQATHKGAKPTRQELSPGRFCASMYSTDGSWSRAEVLAKDDIGCGVEVLYVDFGNTEKCFPSSMQWLCETSAAFPVQAVYCSLHGVKPLQGEDWSDESQKKFLELTQEEALLALTHGFTEDGVCEVELFYSDQEKTGSINQILIDSGLVASIDLPEPSGEPDDLVIPETSQLDVYVSFVNSSTDSVMLRLVGEDFSEKLDELETKMEVAFHEAPEDGSITEGCVFVAYVDGLYHRVRVLENQGKKIKCHFLDHGDTDLLIPDQLRLLDAELNKSLPYQAMEVSLYGLEEVAENVTVLESLFDNALGKTCVAEVVSRDECLSVILFDTFGQEDVNINELIAKTYQEVSATSLLTSHSSPLGSVANLLDRPSDTADRPLDSSFSNKSTDTQSSSVSSLSDTSDGVTSPNKPQDIPESSSLSPKSASYVATLSSKLETGHKVGSVGPMLTPAQQFSSTNVQSETPAAVVTDKLVVRQKSSDSWETEESEEEIGEEIVISSDENSSEANDKSCVEISDPTRVSVTDKSVILISDDDTSIGGGDALAGEEEEVRPSSLYTWGAGKLAAQSSDEDLWDKEAYHRRKVPPHHTLPANGEFCDIHVGFVFDPANFVVTPFESMSDIQRLHQLLNDYMSERTEEKNLSEEEVKLGHLYAGQQDGCWYRTMTRQAVGPELFSVYYPDLGEFNVVDTSELQPLPHQFWSLPFQAFKAKLYAICPAKRTGFWTEGAIYKMKELTEGRNLVGLVRGVDENKVVSLSLVDTSDADIDVCVEDVLVEFEYAQPS